MINKWLKLVCCVAVAGLVLCASIVPAYAMAPNTPYTPNHEEELTLLGYEEEELTLPAYFLTTANLRLRAAPSLNSEIIKTVPQSTRVLVTDRRDGEWYAVYFSGITGYMSAEFLFDLSTLNNLVVGPNGVEKLHWSYVRTFLPRGVPLQITDVRTGITYWISVFSIGNHADVEPVTAEDTAAKFLTRDGRWSWDTRPVWVQVGDRTIAASINGMPHAGSTISGNNMNGHICLHFYGSRTHNGSTNHERSHQASVREALDAAPKATE